MSITIKDLLLIEEPSVHILKDELLKVAGWFVFPSFVIALSFEYFRELKFGQVVKKLVLILTFIGCFYTFHTKAVEISFQGSEELLKKVSPRNVFLKNWTDVKVRTKENDNWSMLEKFAIPNVNDFLGTFFFVVSKLFIWILKLIYTTVYHLTYIFAPITAVLYFFPVTQNSISGTLQSSLWCILMPFVVISILAIVGNSIQLPAASGNLSIVTIDQIIWLSGVTLLLLMAPVITIGLLRGGGVAMSGSAIGVLMTSSGMKALNSIPGVAGSIRAGSKQATLLGKKALFEPSIKELLKEESANSDQNKRMGLVHSHGGFKNPIKGRTSIDDRLEEIGMTKNEAVKFSKVPQITDLEKPRNSYQIQFENNKLKFSSPTMESKSSENSLSKKNNLKVQDQGNSTLVKQNSYLSPDKPSYSSESSKGLDIKKNENPSKKLHLRKLNTKPEVSKPNKYKNTLDLK